ncbi:MAG: hypothetical protein ABSE47_03425 [Acidimicrobiales bacterium]|jgi:hypothetical protein
MDHVQAAVMAAVLAFSDRPVQQPPRWRQSYGSQTVSGGANPYGGAAAPYAPDDKEVR